MILQRAAVMLTLGPLALLLIYLGGWFFFVPVLVLLLIAANEFVRMAGELDVQVPVWLVMASVVGQVSAAGLSSAETAAFLPGLALIVSLFVALVLSLRQFESGGSHASLSLFTTIAAIIYIGWLGSHLLLLRNIDPMRGSIGWQWTAVAIVATWIADTGAYLVGSFLTGKLLGRHPFTPRLSPKKTWEGYLGGVLIGSIAGIVVGVLMFDMAVLPVVIVSVLLASIGTAGDLMISMLKRESGVKDSGNLFPGHGGALDRLDSLLWAVATAYYIVRYFILI